MTKKSLLSNKVSIVDSFQELKELGVDTKFDAKIEIPAPLFHGLSVLVANRMMEGTRLDFEKVTTPSEDDPSVEKVNYVPKEFVSEEALNCYRLTQGLQQCLVNLYNNSPEMFMTKEEAEKLRAEALKARNTNNNNNNK